MGNPLTITFVVYIAAMVLIGFAAYRSTNNLSDYILAVAAWVAWSPRFPPALPT
jgi:hypothetical protein